MFNDSVPLDVEPERALGRARSIFIASGLSVSGDGRGELVLNGKGMTSTNQPSLLAITEGKLTAGHGLLELKAELGGLRFLQKFVLLFPTGLVLGMVIFEFMIFHFIGLHVPEVIRPYLFIWFPAGLSVFFLLFGLIMCSTMSAKIKDDIHRALASIAAE